MSEIRFRPFDIQENIIDDESRMIGAFAGKRCISPESIVLSKDGLKSFSDIVFGDAILGFDQKANQFQFSQSSAAFPKTKCSGFRVIHEQGEFETSADHLIFCADYKYRSCQEIVDSFLNDSNVPSEIFVSPDQTIEALDQKLLTLSAQHLIQTLSGFVDRYVFGNRQYGQRLHVFQETFQSLFLPIFDAPKQALIDDLWKALPMDVIFHMQSKHIHHGQPYDLNPNCYDVGLASCHGAFASVNQIKFDISEHFPDLLRTIKKFLYESGCRLNTALLNQFLTDQSVVSPSVSNILCVEKTQEKHWWDVEIAGINNYVSGGAVHHNSGKTEVGAIKSILWQEQKPNYDHDGIDPFIGAIIAPTTDMLRRLSLKKFLAYAKPFIRSFNKSTHEIEWHDGSMIYGLSADKPHRLEGMKLHWGWL